MVIKLNGGLGTSMGLDRAKSLLEVRDGLTFLDIIARQVLWAREEHDVRLPLVFMDSFRTSDDTRAALDGYDIPVDGLPLDFLQNKEPKLRADDLTPVTWDADPDLEWCPPGHGDLYTALRGSGLLDRLIDAGYTQAFVSNSDNLGATPDPEVAEWFARSGAPFAIEAVRRTPSDRKGGHFARRTSDGRIVLRETAQTLDEDKEALADLSRHRFCSTNNLWFDLVAMRDELDRRDGVLGLALIKNTKTVDPGDPDSPEVIQIESAMGAAVEVFADAAADRGDPRPLPAGEDDQRPAGAALRLLPARGEPPPGAGGRASTRCRSSTSTAATTSWSASSTAASPTASRPCAGPRSSSSRATGPSAPA